MGMDWSLEAGFSWAEDKEHCEEYGRMLSADPSAVSSRAKKRGLSQMGTLGAGNHYAEIQVVDEVLDPWAARKMGIDAVGQVVVMIHSGSRGLGHQVGHAGSGGEREGGREGGIMRLGVGSPRFAPRERGMERQVLIKLV